MRLLKATLVLAARLGSFGSLAVLLGVSAALASDGLSSLRQQAPFIVVAVGMTAGAAVLFIAIKRARSRALRHADLVQLASVPADTPHPILRIGPSGAVLYSNAAANTLLGLIGASAEVWAQWQDALRAMRGIGRTERRLDIGEHVYLLSAVTGTDGCLNVFVLEITDIFAQERALGQSEARLALVTRTARLGLFEVDVPKRTIAYNDIYAWQLGIGPVAQTESLDLWAERIHPAEREATLRAMQDFFAGRIGRYRAEHRLDNGRGGWFWVSAIAEVTEIDPTGLPRQIIGSHLDVTELKASEIALERNNRRSQAQLDLVALGDSGSESAVFACAAQHAAALTGSPGAVLHVFDDKGKIEGAYRFGPSEHPLRASETRLQNDFRDNGQLVARLTAAGRPSAYDTEDTATLQIIGAEAWRLVLRIRQSRKLEIQSRVLQSAVNGIVITDPEGHMEWANPAFERITGYTLDEMIGRDLRFLRSGEHDETFYRRLWETITDGRSFTGEFVNRRKDGTLVTVEQVITPVVGAGGQIEKYISVSQDITERKSVEGRLVFLRQHDELTGLLNRASMVDVMERAITEHERGGAGFAVLYVGLDHFKV